MEKTLYITSKKLMKHKVYVLLNEYGVVEYVGQSKNSHRRYRSHIYSTPKPGNGYFYGRTDLTLEVIKEFDNRRDALKYEGELKLQLGFEWTEHNRALKLGSITGAKNGLKNKEKASKRILVYDAKTNDFIGEFPSQIEFARLYNLHQAAVNRVVVGKQKTTGGFIIRNKQCQ